MAFEMATSLKSAGRLAFGAYALMARDYKQLVQLDTSDSRIDCLKKYYQQLFHCWMSFRLL